MASVKSFVFFLLLPMSNFGQVFEILNDLHQTTNFALKYYEDINFDGLLGFVIAEAQIKQSLQITTDPDIMLSLKLLSRKSEIFRNLLLPILPDQPPKMHTLKKYLLRPENWITYENFTENSLQNLGIYPNWTVDTIIHNKAAWYKGVPSDHCLMEILNQNCYKSPFCDEMMLASRTDTGYLLSHRLFYLQIVRMKRCEYEKNNFRRLTNKLCSLMLKEIRTNDYLNFPSHDIALEQMVLCGIEGYSEFLDKNWRNEVLAWKTPFGCFKSREELNSKRSSNVIEFGCSDHSTGLGTAALALNLRFILWKNDGA